MKKPWQKERSTGGEAAVQLRGGGRNAFGRLSGYVPLLDGETALYRDCLLYTSDAADEL